MVRRTSKPEDDTARAEKNRFPMETIYVLHPLYQVFPETVGVVIPPPFCHEVENVLAGVAAVSVPDAVAVAVAGCGC